MKENEKLNVKEFRLYEKYNFRLPGMRICFQFMQLKLN